MDTSATCQVVCPADGAVNRVPVARLADSPVCGKCRSRLFVSAPVEVGATAFDLQLTRSELPLLVDFWAPWCGPCRAMAPAFQKAAARLEPQVRLMKVNTEDHPALAARYGIRSIPTMILFAGGRELARQSGAMSSPEQIVAWARQYL